MNLKTWRAGAILCGVAALNACGLFQPKQTPFDLYLRAELETEHGQLDQALHTLSTVIEKSPNLEMAYESRGDIYKQQGNYEAAAKDYEHAVSLAPFDFPANFQLGVIYQYLKRFVDAVERFKQALQVRPLDPEANMNLAMTYMQLNDPLTGLTYAETAVRLNPNSAPYQANIGILYSQIGFSTEAIDHFKQSIEINSKQPEVYVNLGQEYLKTGKFEQAKNVLETAKSLAPSAAVSDRLGVAYYRLKDYAKATASFNEALRQDPKFVTALNGLGVVAMSRSLESSPPDLEQARVALDYWNKSLKINANQPEIQNLVNKYGGPK